MAKLLLPWFGGSAAVWVTCILFFQCALVAGYLVAYLASRFLAPRVQAWTLAALLLPSLALLPISPSPAWRPIDGHAPIAHILVLLLRFAGAPYVLLTATGPLLQTWFVARHAGRDPYRLFALSNLGSLLGLLAYPFAFEPLWSSHEQTRLWAAAYAFFVAIAVTVAVGQARASATALAPLSTARGDTPSWQTVGAWLALPACATLLLLAITNHLTEDVAATPFLWVVPLALYLLSFIVCFQMPRLYRRGVFIPLLAVALVVMGYVRWRGSLELDAWPRIVMCVVGLFVACMVCHGEVWRRRPAPARLAAFYLTVAFGGALGGVCAAVVAPLLLPYTVELQIGLFACALLVGAPLIREVQGLSRPQSDREGRRRAWVALSSVVYLVGLGALLTKSVTSALEGSRVVARNAYGSVREFDGHLRSGAQYRKMAHGTIVHGIQWLAPERHREPTAYFCPDSGIGLALRDRDDAPLSRGAPPPEPPRGFASNRSAALRDSRTIGVIGLGVGTLAAYAQPGDHWRYYELNPLVIELARRDFTFLSDAAASVEMVEGDARLSLSRESPRGFDILVLDAFAGDAIPAHLLTREAFALYLTHLAPAGLIAAHVSNRNVDLVPVVADAAEVFHLQSRVVESYGAINDASYCFRATWILLTRDAARFDRPPFADLPRALPKPGFAGWTDDRSSVLSVLK
jgi:hypothetical protein